MTNVLRPTGGLAAAFLIAVLTGAPTPASAHPHVWVSVETTVVYDGGNVSALKHRWAFDEMYAALAVQGLDKNNDGAYEKDELAELAKINMDGLKEFAYFTEAKLGETPLKFGEPRVYWLEYKDNVLSLTFTLPLAEPVLADAQGFAFSVYDQTYFIAFDMAKEKPVTLASGAPAGCSAVVGSPEQAAEADKLKDAFASEMGGAFGIGLAKTISVTCPKS